LSVKPVAEMIVLGEEIPVVVCVTTPEAVPSLELT